MEITYDNKKVEKQCKNFKQAKKDFPEKIAKKLHKLINFIENAENLSEVISFPRYNFHNLKGDREGFYAMDIDGRRSKYRLIVTFEDLTNETIFINSVAIKDIEIKEVSKHYE